MQPNVTQLRQATGALKPLAHSRPDEGPHVANTCAPRTGAQTPRRIAVVDDDPRIRRVLRTALEGAGFAVTEANSEADVLAALRLRDIALITLDLTLRHDDGLSIVRSVRRISSVPVVVVSGRSSDIDRIVALEVGADDYVVKPFNVREVLARIRAVLRRTNPYPAALAAPGSDILPFGVLALDVAAHDLKTPAGKALSLTTTEFRLADAFVRHPGRVLSRDFLIDAVGGSDAELLERCIDTNVSRLRRKIAEGGGDPHLIKTVRGAGYMFTGKTRT
ncbi:MAG: response regulator transcription factor [Hyphomicrobium sp.]|nr:response regulator transcription factor [Hyphomicrobium sp.]